jgi:hypothetical protein
MNIKEKNLIKQQKIDKTVFKIKFGIILTVKKDTGLNFFILIRTKVIKIHKKKI